MNAKNLTHFADSMFGIEPAPPEADAEVPRYTAHRALPLPAEPMWVAPRRTFIPQGCTQQDRVKPTIEPRPPVDRVREDYDSEDQSEGADGVFWFYLATIGAVIATASLAVWA